MRKWHLVLLSGLLLSGCGKKEVSVVTTAAMTVAETVEETTIVEETTTVEETTVAEGITTEAETEEITVEETTVGYDILTPKVLFSDPFGGIDVSSATFKINYSSSEESCNTTGVLTMQADTSSLYVDYNVDEVSNGETETWHQIGYQLDDGTLYAFEDDKWYKYSVYENDIGTISDFIDFQHLTLCRDLATLEETEEEYIVSGIISVYDSTQIAGGLIDMMYDLGVPEDMLSTSKFNAKFVFNKETRQLSDFSLSIIPEDGWTLKSYDLSFEVSGVNSSEVVVPADVKRSAVAAD